MIDTESNGWNRIAMTVAWVMVSLFLAEASCNTNERLKRVKKDVEKLKEKK